MTDQPAVVWEQIWPPAHSAPARLEGRAMTDARAVMQQALEALEAYSRWAATREVEMQACNAITALRAALEAQAQPVAPFGWAIACNNGTTAFCRPRVTNFFGAIMDREPFEQDDVTRCDREWPGLAPHRLVTLYVHPPAQPQGWVLVPEEPTPEMRNAFHAVTDSESTLKGAAGSRWAAMLAARPQPKETT